MSLARAFLIAWVVNFIALWVAISIVGSASVSGTGTLVIAAAVFSLLNVFLRPVLMLLGLPLRIITFGLVTFLINMLMVLITAWIVSGIHLGGFVGVAAVTIVIWIVNMLLHLVLRASRVARRA
jgi:putative membrane protein